MSSKKLTVLFTPVDAFGHINACAGLGQALLSRGHRVVFAITKPFKGVLAKLGFEEQFYEKREEQDNEIDPQKVYQQMLIDLEEAMKSKDYLDANKAILKSGMMERMVKGLNEADPQYEAIIEEVRPDMIVIDHVAIPVSVLKSGIPFVNLLSTAPLWHLNFEQLPPGACGLPANDSRDWESRRQEVCDYFRSLYKPCEEYYSSHGLDVFKPKNRNTHPSPFGDFFMYPKELDYFENIEMPETWYRFDTFIRHEAQEFEIPEKLKNLPGKLIYFSLGSYGAMALPMLKRLVAILAKSPNSFIVSAGPSLGELELSDNIWADKFLPQTAVIPLVDLVITHGGNNSLTETMYFGKPMIVLPLFADQPDNAQRVFEKGLGLRFHAWHVKEAELLAGIEKVLSDTKLKARMEKIGERMRSANSQIEAAKVIEEIVGKHLNVKTNN